MDIITFSVLNSEFCSNGSLSTKEFSIILSDWVPSGNSHFHTSKFRMF